MNEEYYVLEEGEKIGPFSFDELIQRGLDVDTPVLIPLADTWQNASYLPEFNEYFEANGYYFPTEDNLAGFAWRAIAFMTDYILISVLAILIDLQLGWIALPSTPVFNTLPQRTMMIVELSFAVLFLIYNGIFEATGIRGSLGKKLFNLKVVDEDGRQLTLFRSIARNFGALVSFMLYGLPFLTLFLSEHKQTWYDRLIKTYTIRNS